MGNYFDNKPIGKHAILYSNENISEKIFLKPKKEKL